jgi:hypothetical protein
MSKNLGPVSVSVPAAGRPGYQAVGNLIAAYAELVDDGDFAGVGALVGDATFEGSGAPVTGSDAIEQMLRNTVIVYDDGTPRTSAGRPALAGPLVAQLVTPPPIPAWKIGIGPSGSTC